PAGVERDARPSLLLEGRHEHLTHRLVVRAGVDEDAQLLPGERAGFGAGLAARDGRGSEAGGGAQELTTAVLTHRRRSGGDSVTLRNVSTAAQTRLAVVNQHSPPNTQAQMANHSGNRQINTNSASVSVASVRPPR